MNQNQNPSANKSKTSAESSKNGTIQTGVNLQNKFIMSIIQAKNKKTKKKQVHGKASEQSQNMNTDLIPDFYDCHLNGNIRKSISQKSSENWDN